MSKQTDITFGNRFSTDAGTWKRYIDNLIETTPTPRPTGIDLFEANIDHTRKESNFFTYKGDPASVFNYSQVIVHENGKEFNFCSIDDLDLSRLKFYVYGAGYYTWPEYYWSFCNSRPFVPEHWGWKKISDDTTYELGRWTLKIIEKNNVCNLQTRDWSVNVENTVDWNLRTDYKNISFNIPTTRRYLEIADSLVIKTS